MDRCCSFVSPVPPVHGAWYTAGDPSASKIEKGVEQPVVVDAMPVQDVCKMFCNYTLRNHAALHSTS